MSQMINIREKLIRINPSNSHKIEYSKTSVKSWHTDYSGSSYGNFSDLTDNSKEVLANTSKGLFYSATNG
ncbi:hypothetical protein [Flavobacterium caseinilyticum]|uniref:Uncharacterized protein n=1 Tax=Flavobacterium caseinilyticum TaxID=2541732 RepID=A0A4R5ASG3_9FLAO|nr:hypothetical protein [Flavobacterium caseinilyticum]TDD74636.1 hypothetical protein E0F89_14110 [Flavobacterium caseinilyticum]